MKRGRSWQPDRRRTLGAAGEAAAAEYLASLGYTILETNWRSRFGEADLIAKIDETIVFVEVRSRSAGSLHTFGMPLESITPKKQMTIRRLAEAYLQRHPEYRRLRVRFDCIGMILDPEGQAADIRHVTDAF